MREKVVDDSEGISVMCVDEVAYNAVGGLGEMVDVYQACGCMFWEVGDGR